MFRAVGLVRAARVAVRAFAPAEAYAASAKSSSWVVASRGFTSSPITAGVIQYPPASVEIGKPAPNFKATALVNGEFKQISLSDYKGKYVVLFFYPKDFTYVCPTEIIAFSDRSGEFEKINTQVIAASCDTPEVHLAWVQTPRKRGGLGHMQIPILADETKAISADYGVLVKEMGIPLRGLFIIDPEGNLQQMTINNLDIGRNVDETLRLVQALQYVAANGVVCPAGWRVLVSLNTVLPVLFPSVKATPAVLRPDTLGPRTPGAKSMKAGPEASQEYFSSLEDDDFTAGLTAITSPAEYEKAIASGPAVVDFYASWCGKCRQIAPFVDELKEKHPGVKFYKIDTDDKNLVEMVKGLGVTALPVFKAFKGGKEVMSVEGYKKQPLADAVALVA